MDLLQLDVLLGAERGDCEVLLTDSFMKSWKSYIH